jgi:hypothetical protein
MVVHRLRSFCRPLAVLARGGDAEYVDQILDGLEARARPEGSGGSTAGRPA